jgi:hypothetical protein
VPRIIKEYHLALIEADPEQLEHIHMVDKKLTELPAKEVLI